MRKNKSFHLLAATLGVALGALWLIAGASKIFTYDAFSANVTSMLGLGGLIGGVIATFVLLAEMLVGLGLLVGIARQTMFSLSILLMTIINVGLLLFGDASASGIVSQNLNYVLVSGLGLYATMQHKCLCRRRRRTADEE